MTNSKANATFILVDVNQNWNFTEYNIAPSDHDLFSWIVKFCSYSNPSYKRIRNHFILKSSLPFCVGVVFIEKLNEYNIDLGFDIDPLIKIDRFLKALWNFIWEIHRFLFSIITLTVHFTHQLKCVHKTNMKTAKNHLIHAFWWSWFCAFGKVASWRGY